MLFGENIARIIFTDGGSQCAFRPFCVCGKERVKDMRLDKFLKVSRLIKRRTVANEACDAGRVLVTGNVAKASVKVRIGDVIEIQFGTKSVRVEVLDIKETTKKEEAGNLFKYL